MRRIAAMVIRLFLKAPYFLFRIWLCGRKKPIDYDNSYRVIRHVCKKANHAGRVRIEAHGLENLPEEDGFMFFPNHQGLYDVLAIIDSCERPFAFVIKKEASKVILLKQIVEATGSLSIDREDLRQSMEVIHEVTRQVREGRNFLIFAEGTRSRQGNRMNEMKGGSFKSAVKAQCSIVPVALIDAFRPFDEKSIRPVTVHVIYLKPIPYEEYKGMKTHEIAALVRGCIEDSMTAWTMQEEGT
jgi:1-acyl-sn-glycerol-3-phosphate acyltransferase